MADVDSISAGANATPQPMEVEVGPDQPQRNSSNASGDWQNLQILFLFWQHHLQCGNFFPFPEIKCFRFLKPSPIYESILQLCSWGTASLCCLLQGELEMIVIVADSWDLATPHPCQPAVKSCWVCPGLDSSIDH